MFILILLTVLGHACELPIGLAIAAHAHDDGQESSDHHSDDSQFDCAAVLATQTKTHAAPRVDVAADVVRPHPALTTVASQVVTALPDLHPRRLRPPLFLLHASLLI